MGQKAEEAPVYQKMRMSAREKEEQRATEEKGGKGQKNEEGNGTDNEQERGGTVSWNNQLEGQSSAGVYGESRKQKKSGETGRDGVLLLGFGIFMFFITAAAGVMTGTYKRRGL